MINLMLAFVLSVVLHLSAMAIALHLFGVQLQRIAFGIGPAILKVGIVTVSPLLVAGSITMLDSRESPLREPELRRAFNHQPVWVQVLVPLSGVFALCLVSCVLIGSEMLPALLVGFKHIFNIFPLETPQTQLRSVQVFCETHSFSTVLGFTAAKVAALNLLPFPFLNGGQALINLAKMGKAEARWENALLQWSIWPGLFLVTIWTLSIAVYVFKLMLN